MATTPQEHELELMMREMDADWQDWRAWHQERETLRRRCAAQAQRIRTLSAVVQRIGWWSVSIGMILGAAAGAALYHAIELRFF